MHDSVLVVDIINYIEFDGIEFNICINVPVRFEEFHLIEVPSIITTTIINKVIFYALCVFCFVLYCK